MFKRGIDTFIGIKGKSELLHDIALLEKEVESLKKQLSDYKKTTIKYNGHKVLFKDIAGEFNNLDIGI